MSDERCNADLGQLTANLVRLQKKVSELESKIEGYKAVYKAQQDMLQMAQQRHADDVERSVALMTERDEARRMYCRCRMDLEGVPMGDLNEKGAAFAASRGWDCFKKQTESTDAVDTK